MNIEFELLEELANEVEGDARATYSGRGMFGRNCVGIVLESESNLLALGVAIAELIEDEELKGVLINNTKTDSMGRSIIAYWESVSCDDAPEDSDEDE